MLNSRAMRTVLLCLLGTTSAVAQLAVGVRGGVPLTDFLSVASNPMVTLRPNSNRFVIGPTVELHLPVGFAVEVDALYRRLDYTAGQNLVDAFIRSSANNAWEFPLLVKYKAPGVLLRPFLDSGVAFNHWTANRQFTAVQLVTKSNTGVNGTGLVLGGGLEIHVPLIRVSPEIRFTHWSAKDISDFSSLLRFNQNQAEFLIGITF